MTVKGLDGFDLYNGLASGNHQVGANWPTSNLGGGNQTQQYLPSGGRFGGGAMQFTNAAAGVNNMVRLSGAGTIAGTIGGACKMSTGSTAASAGRGLIEAYEGSPASIEHLAMYFFSDNTMRLFRGTTQLAASSALTGILNSWHFLEMSFSIADSGGTCAGYVDGTQVVTFTGDTKNGGTTGHFDSIVIGNGGQVGVAQWDDIYWSDSATPLGDRRVDVIYPNADTAQKDFHPQSGSNNYAMVADIPNDGDTSYVFTGSSSAEDLYDVVSLPTSSASIEAVQVNAVARRVDAGGSTLTLEAKSGSTKHSDGGHTLSTNYVNYQMLLLTNPDTSAAWTDTDITGLKLGISVVNT